MKVKTAFLCDVSIHRNLLLKLQKVDKILDSKGQVSIYA